MVVVVVVVLCRLLTHHHGDADLSQTTLTTRSLTGGPTLWPGGAGLPAQPPNQKIVARPSNLAVLLTHCGQLILRKISEFDANKFRF